MSKYMVPLLKIIIFLVAIMVMMRGYYLWSLRKKQSKYTFRNQDGDLAMLVVILLLMNRSSLQRYSLSYEPILRYLYPILIGLFIAYSFLQLTQITMVTNESLINPERVLGVQEITQYKVKKSLYRYKMIIYYKKKDKEARLTLLISKKDKEFLTQLFKKHNINIV